MSEKTKDSWVDALLKEWEEKRAIICGDFNAVTGDRKFR